MILIKFYKNTITNVIEKTVCPSLKVIKHILGIKLINVKLSTIREEFCVIYLVFVFTTEFSPLGKFADGICLLIIVVRG